MSAVSGCPAVNCLAQQQPSQEHQPQAQPQESTSAGGLLEVVAAADEDDRGVNCASSDDDDDDDEQESDDEISSGELSESSAYEPSDDEAQERVDRKLEKRAEREVDDDSFDLHAPSLANQRRYEQKKAAKANKRKRSRAQAAIDTSDSNSNSDSVTDSEQPILDSEEFVVDDMPDAAGAYKEPPGAPRKKPRRRVRRELLADEASDPGTASEECESPSAKRPRKKTDRFRAGVSAAEECEAMRAVEAIDGSGEGGGGMLDFRAAAQDMVFSGYSRTASKFMRDHFWDTLQFGNNAGSHELHVDLARGSDARLVRFACTSYETVCCLCQTVKPCFGVIKTETPFFVASDATHNIDAGAWVSGQPVPESLRRDRELARNYPKVGIDCASKLHLYQTAGALQRKLCAQSLYYRQLLRSAADKSGPLAEQIALDIKATAERIGELETDKNAPMRHARVHLPEWHSLAKAYNEVHRKKK